MMTRVRPSKLSWVALTLIVATGVSLLLPLTGNPTSQSSAGISPAGGASAGGCQTQACHQEIGQGPIKHSPVSSGACTVCHIEVPGKKHRFRPGAEGAQLCYMCHPSQQNMKVVHQPVVDGLCTACHDPHSSTNRFLLTAESIPTLCFSCHPDDKTIEKVVHGPVAVGACTSCHDPHQSPFPYRLRYAGNDLCFSCHLDKAELFANAKNTHPPAAEDCNNCHDPHNSPNGYRLRVSVPDLCFTCHQDKESYISTVRTKHDAVLIGEKCLNCHDPHTSQIGKQLKSETIYLCLNCHNQEQQTPTGKIQNIGEWLKNNPDHHGPIRQNDCVGCHNPHGSENFRILKKYFPPQFYAKFDLQNYELCFSCHMPDLVLEPKTANLTGFRNADRNLHYVHVNRMEKGRTCRACHQIHASIKPKHIRESVPFGGWELPINYKKDDTGGRCSPGCHVSRGYDRNEAIINK